MLSCVSSWSLSPHQLLLQLTLGSVVSVVVVAVTYYRYRLIYNAAAVGAAVRVFWQQPQQGACSLVARVRLARVAYLKERLHSSLMLTTECSCRVEISCCHLCSGTSESFSSFSSFST